MNLIFSLHFFSLCSFQIAGESQMCRADPQLCGNGQSPVTLQSAISPIALSRGFIGLMSAVSYPYHRTPVWLMNLSTTSNSTDALTEKRKKYIGVISTSLMSLHGRKAVWRHSKEHLRKRITAVSRQKIRACCGSRELRRDPKSVVGRRVEASKEPSCHALGLTESQKRLSARGALTSSRRWCRAPSPSSVFNDSFSITSPNRSGLKLACFVLFFDLVIIRSFIQKCERVLSYFFPPPAMDSVWCAWTRLV